MIKISVADMIDASFLVRLWPMIKGFIKTIKPMGIICMVSEDTIYKWHFIRDYMPELYKRHTSELNANCIFCANLVRSGCHRHCLKCSIGTYIHCSPQLPGILYYEARHPYIIDRPAVPWYYKETCGSFRRLPQKHYFRNLHVLLSPIHIYNFEVLEGLENGLTSGKKPCHVCASMDYGLYRKCSGQEDFDVSTPCRKIISELRAIYHRQADL